MQSDSAHTERRKHRRYDVPGLVIAVPNRSHSQVARIVNISKGGMAVRYVDQDDWLGAAGDIDILVNSDFFVTNIRIESIRDFKVIGRVPFSIVSERQCCLQFKSLSQAQKNLIDDFIEKYTGGNS